MRRITRILLALCIFLTMTACKTAPETGAEMGSEMVSEMVSEMGSEMEPEMELEIESEMEPEIESEMEPEIEPEEETRLPGLAVFIDNVFDHFDDPPPEDKIRLICIKYTDTTDHDDEIEVLLIDKEAEMPKVLSIIYTFYPSDYEDAIALDYEIEIQFVRDGRHQYYSIIFDEYEDRYFAYNYRDAGNWYETSEENFQLLMDYFDGASTSG